MRYRVGRVAKASAIVLAVVSAVLPARATVVPWMSLEEITARAEVIVSGTVESTESAWSDDGRIIVTRATVRVERALKGGPRGRVIVETPGGRVGDQTMIASGAPRFATGERVVLFLEPAGPGGAATPRHAVVGWNQGRMTVRRDPRTGRDLVDDPTTGTLYLDKSGRPVEPRGTGKGPSDLGAFLAEVERLVATRPAGAAP